MNPVELPPLEPTAIRPSGGQWQPPANDVRVAGSMPTSDAWALTGAGWPARPEEVISLFFSWPETKTNPSPQAVKELRQLFFAQAMDASNPEAFMAKLQTILQKGNAQTVATDWTAGLINALRTQLAQQAPVKAGESPDGITQLLRYAITVLSRESNPAPPLPRLLVPSPPSQPLVRYAQNAGAQSYLIGERETASGLLTQPPSANGQTPAPAATPRTLPEAPAQPAPQGQPGTNAPANPNAGATGNSAATPHSPNPSGMPNPSQAPPSRNPTVANTQTPAGTPGSPAPNAAQPQPQTGGGAPATPTASPQTGSTPAAAPTAPGTAAPSAASATQIPQTATPSPPTQGQAPAQNAGGTALPNASGTPPNADPPLVSLAEMAARASSMAQKAQSPPQLPWLTVAQQPIPSASPARTQTTAGSAQPQTPGGAPAAQTQSGSAAPQAPVQAAGADRSAATTGAARGDAPAQQQALAEARAAQGVRGEARVDLPGTPAAAASRADEAGQTVLPQQRVGMLPLVIGNEPVPAWLQMEWMPVADREGHGGKASSGQSLMVSVHVAGDTLGRVAFHLAWLPKELAGTIVIEKPEILQAARLELPELEKRLTDAGLPTPRLRLLKHTSAPWEEEAPEADPS